MDKMYVHMCINTYEYVYKYACKICICMYVYKHAYSYVQTYTSIYICKKVPNLHEREVFSTRELFRANKFFFKFCIKTWYFSRFSIFFIGIVFSISACASQNPERSVRRFINRWYISHTYAYIYISIYTFDY
jgi:hypothetical protein